MLVTPYVIFNTVIVNSRILHDPEFTFIVVRQESQAEGNYGLVVDGSSLQVLLDNLKDNFYSVCSRCVAVVCCRMTPKQKAEVRFPTEQSWSGVVHVGKRFSRLPHLYLFCGRPYGW